MLRHWLAPLSSLSCFALLTSGCGDPCADDGLGQGDCVDRPGVSDDGADATGSDTSGEGTDSVGTEDGGEGGSGDGGTGDEDNGDETSEPDETDSGEETTGDTDDGGDTGDTDDSGDTSDGGDTGDTGGLTTWCDDEDGDGYGDPDECEETDTPQDGWVENGDDCDDGSATTFPGAAPNDDPDACMEDEDGDDWGDDEPSTPGVTAGTDCDDSQDFTFPGAAPNDDPDACMEDEDDDDYGDDTPSDPGTAAGTDCDDSNDALVTECDAYCADEDDDGFGDPDDCQDMPGTGYVDNNDDCDDSDPNTFPGAAPNDDADACMKDTDGDDWGDDTPVNPAVTAGTDCDDDSVNTFPGAAPNDDADACMEDDDGDDWGDDDPASPTAVAGTDCDDSSATTFPGAAEIEDPDACMEDEDDDGWGDARPDTNGVEVGSDCFDLVDSLNPDDAQMVTFSGDGEVEEIDLVTPAIGATIAFFDTFFIPGWSPITGAIDPTGQLWVPDSGQLYEADYCAGDEPVATSSGMGENLCGIAFMGDGSLYGIDGGADEIAILDPNTGAITSSVPITTAGGDPINVGSCGVAWDCHGDVLIVLASNESAIYEVDPTTGIGTPRFSDTNINFGGSIGMEYDPVTRNAWVAGSGTIYEATLDGSDGSTEVGDMGSSVNDLIYGPSCNN